MKYGFVKCAAASPEIRVADVFYNTQNILDIICHAQNEGVKLLVLPELCLTGSTCGDLFLQRVFIDAAMSALMDICRQTKQMDIVFALGLPVAVGSCLYNAACVVYKGEILGFVPKTVMSWQEKQFKSADNAPGSVCVDGKEYPMSKNLIFKNKSMPEFCFGVKVGADGLCFASELTQLCAGGANIILNTAADSELVGKSNFRRNAIKVMSANMCCGYVFANAGEGESTTDFVFNGQCMVCENGSILCEKEPYIPGIAISEIDVFKICTRRTSKEDFKACANEALKTVFFDMKQVKCDLTRFVSKNPFIPEDEQEAYNRCEEILAIQAKGLEKRFVHCNSKTMVIGISGGLDSCLALLVACKTADMLGISRKNIIAVTMPCFGTSERTKNNAVVLCELLGVTLMEIDISKSVLLHFEDIGHNKSELDVIYENSQARERTQVLMDVANKHGGLVVGTGDLSELALGWATYNGDHMSMYGVNAGVPKTLVRRIISHLGNKESNKKLSEILLDVAVTPVSPELLPPDNDGKIAQVTEDIVGPYELHDFFIYYFLRNGYSPEKINMLAQYAFEGQYNNETIEKWLRTFIRRFFAMQFKRSCLPDGPAVGCVSISPREGLKMPSDALNGVWFANLD